MATLSIVIVPTKMMSTGRHRVRIAVAHRSQTRYIPTQFILDSSAQMKNGKVVKHENAININTCLRKLIYEYEEILSSISYLPAISCTDLIHLITSQQQKKGITFGSVLQEYLSYMETEERQKSHKLYHIAGEKFLKSIKGDLPLAQLNPMHIQHFVELMYKEGLKNTTVKIYLTLVRVVLNYAVKMNHVHYSVHPFVMCKMPVGNIRELDLSIDELRNIRDVKLHSSCQAMARDVFMLTYYLGGINLRDLMEYNFKEGHTMRYIRHKTRNSKKGDNEIVFTIQPEAIEIIKRYRSSEGKLVFGRYASYEKVYSLVFRHINKVSANAKVNRKVSYYSARKTFAQHGYDVGIEIEKIEYCIGHSMKNNRPIFNYIRIMQEHADKVFRAIFDQLL